MDTEKKGVVDNRSQVYNPKIDAWVKEILIQTVLLL
jgi:hypothetical protein